MAIKSRTTADDEKVNFIISHLEGAAREEIRYRPASEKKKPREVLAILHEVFGDKGTLSELFSEFLQCQQGEEQSLQEFSHVNMCKLDKIYKRDPKAIPNRDLTLRNQFAENVKPVWLRRDLKKRIRERPEIVFSDIREEATLLMEDSQESKQQAPAVDYDATVFVSQAKTEKSEISNVLSELKSELQTIKSELETMKASRQSGQSIQQRNWKPKCYYCGRLGHIKRECRQLKTRLRTSSTTFKRPKPTARSRALGTDKGSSLQNVVRKMIGKSPILNIKIKDTVCFMHFGYWITGEHDH